MLRVPSLPCAVTVYHRRKYEGTKAEGSLCYISGISVILSINSISLKKFLHTHSQLQPTCFSRTPNDLGYFGDISSMTVPINWGCPRTLKPTDINIQFQQVQHRAMKTVRKAEHIEEKRNSRRWVYSVWRRFMENLFAILLQRVTATY